MGEQNSNKGRPARISRQMVGEAAMEIADEISAEKVTLKKVADRLGVSTMALYRHVSDKRDLELLIAVTLIKRIFRPVEISSETPWQEILSKSLDSLNRAFVSHPTILKVFTDQRYFLSNENLLLMEQIHEGLARAGVPLEERRTISRIFGNFVIGSVFFGMNSGNEGLERIERMMLKASGARQGLGPYENISAAVAATMGKDTTSFAVCTAYLLKLIARSFCETDHVKTGARSQPGKI